MPSVFSKKPAFLLAIVLVLAITWLFYETILSEKTGFFSLALPKEKTAYFAVTEGTGAYYCPDCPVSDDALNPPTNNSPGPSLPSGAADGASTPTFVQNDDGLSQTGATGGVNELGQDDGAAPAGGSYEDLSKGGDPYDDYLQSKAKGSPAAVYQMPGQNLSQSGDGSSLCPECKPQGSSAASSGLLQPCVQGWFCSGSTRVYSNADCSRIESEFCSGGCLNGKCLQSCKSCSRDFAGQCGSFSNDCGGTIQCSCSAGWNCINGKCCKALSCSESECGSKSNNCGQKIDCTAKCEEGFYCSQENRCILKAGLQDIDPKNVQVFAFATHAKVYWNTLVQSDSAVEFGETSALGSRVFDGTKTIHHKIHLLGLKPETNYFFKAVSSTQSLSRESPVLSFKTSLKDEPLQVLTVLVDPESRQQFEGQYFYFTAITNALNEESLEFFWDFGDDSNASQREAFHAYFLGLEKEREFLVKVRVSDSKGQTAGAEVKVKVLKSKFKARVLEPTHVQTNSKQRDLNVRLEFLDEADERIACQGISLRVLLAGSLVEMHCSGTIFEGIFKPWSSLSETEFLEIHALSEVKGEKREFHAKAPVFFEPSFFKATNVFKGKKYFLLDSLEKAKVMFLLNGIIVVFPSELRAVLVSGKKEEEVRIEKNEFDYTLYFDHTVNETDFLHGLKLKLKGRDAAGNKVDEVQAVPLAKNSALVISILEPVNSEREYAFGQTVNLKAKILSDNYKVKNKKIIVECPELDFLEEMDFDKESQQYSAKILLPLQDSGKKSVSCRLEAHATLDGKELMDLEFLTISLSNNLQMVFVQPSAGLNKPWNGKISEISVRFFQPNNHLFANIALNSDLLVDGNLQPVSLKFDEKEKLHKGVLSSPLLAGTHSLKLVLKEDFSGEGTVIATIEQGLSLALLAFGFACIVILVFLALLLRNVFSERAFLLREKERLTGLEKKYKFEFFKRHISESELGEQIRLLSKGLKCIDSLLKSGFWIKTGFWKTVFPSKDFKKAPEKVQAIVLTTRLCGRIGEFSREEVARGLRNEGYSEKVIEMVLARLYKER
ncbi:MAG: hypothetical protein QXK06_00375 [Candidatus Diapherotrites archaeon]